MVEEHCHVLIAETAKAMAREVYADTMRDNTLYVRWKKMCPELTPVLAEDKFVMLLWPHLIPQARSTLQSMLGGRLAETLKEQIYDALILDATLGRGRVL